MRLLSYGVGAKGSSVYLFMKDMHYDMGVLVWR